MKKLLYIAFVFAFLLVVSSCCKEEVTPNREADPFATTYEDCGTDCGTKGAEISTGNNGDGITDPDEDEDYDAEDTDGKDGIVDPDEDEDYDADDGK